MIKTTIFVSFPNGIFFIVMSTVYKAQEPLALESYRVRATSPSKVIMTPKRKELPKMKEKEKFLAGTGNPILNRKQRDKPLLLLKKRGEV